MKIIVDSKFADYAKNSGEFQVAAIVERKYSVQTGISLQYSWLI
jgi:hypothetical protein